MNTVEQRYLKAIRSRVCHHCPDLMDDGVCGLADRVCPVEQSVREIVLMVHYLHAESIFPYLTELRRILCDACEHQDASGHCPRREQLDCALDRYFILVVEAIDDVHRELLSEADAALSGS